jgi:hypothetical protein
MPPTSDDSGPHLTPRTKAKLTLGQLGAGIGAIVTFAVFVTGVYLRVQAHLDTLDAALARHVGDVGAHMAPNFQISHGAPVGTFDFHETLSALTLEIDELKKRPFILDGDTCRQVKGGTLCQQK